jgi:hypothetical protein
LIPQSPQQELENLHSTKPPFVPDLGRESKQERKQVSNQLQEEQFPHISSPPERNEMIVI